MLSLPHTPARVSTSNCYKTSRCHNVIIGSMVVCVQQAAPLGRFLDSRLAVKDGKEPSQPTTVNPNDHRRREYWFLTVSP